MKQYLSYGGGVNSTAMLLLLYDEGGEMKAENKKKAIEAIDLIGRALVDIAETLDIIKTYIYKDAPDKPSEKPLKTPTGRGE